MPLILYNKTGNWIEHRKRVRKKRKKNARKRSRESKDRKRNSHTAALDSSTIISGIQYNGADSKRVINRVVHKGESVYLPQVHKEVTRGRPSEKTVRHRLNTFVKKMKRKMPGIESPTKEEVKNLPVGGKDKIIYGEAERAGSEYIITIDKGFIESTKRLRIKALKPLDYIRMRRRNKYRGKR